MNPTNGVIMESGVIVVGVASLDGTRNLRFRIRETDTMKKLIDTYSKMESVTPAAIQLIFKGNPIAESDTPTKINLQNNDILEVCRVPGVQNSQMVTKSSIPDIKSEVKLASPPKSPPKSPVSPVVSAPLMPSASNEYISRVLSKFANGNSGKTSPKRPAPDSSRSILTQSIPSLLNPAISQSGSSPLKNSHLNLDMLNYPVPGGFPGVSASQLSPNQTPLITSNNNNNQIGQNQTRKITELELELTQARLKIVEFQRYMQFVQARLILSDRATEEKNNLIKQKDKTIEQLRLELDRREQIFRAYGIGKSVTSGSGENSASGGVLDSPKALARKSPKSAGSSVGSNSSKGSNSGSDASQPTPSSQPTPVPASIPVPVPVPGPSWK